MEKNYSGRYVGPTYNSYKRCYNDIQSTPLNFSTKHEISWIHPFQLNTRWVEPNSKKWDGANPFPWILKPSTCFASPSHLPQHCSSTCRAAVLHAFCEAGGLCRACAHC
uniref:Uncharacterized protein n=1 Tax=Setaria viridis TaxID=4556 RepID=A0A4U6WAF8_SETVI|nr:hypothetical protein SEVIR_1G197100v2 [Setaria viridis]